MTAANQSEPDWSLTTWKGSRRRQHADWLALPLRRKLEAVEQMCDFARENIARRKALGQPYVDPYTGEVVGPESSRR